MGTTAQHSQHTMGIWREGLQTPCSVSVPPGMFRVSGEP